MRQVLQSLGSGEIEVVAAPAPSARPGHVLIETRRTLISAGTERMLLSFGRGNLVQKARQQPGKVRQTLQKIATDGLSATVEAVRAKFDQPSLRGHCNAGVTSEVGARVARVNPGAVASATQSRASRSSAGLRNSVSFNGLSAIIKGCNAVCKTAPPGLEDGPADEQIDAGLIATRQGRHAPIAAHLIFAVRMKKPAISCRGPDRSVTIIEPGATPAAHWVHDPTHCGDHRAGETSNALYVDILRRSSHSRSSLPRRPRSASRRPTR